MVGYVCLWKTRGVAAWGGGLMCHNTWNSVVFLLSNSRWRRSSTTYTCSFMKLRAAAETLNSCYRWRDFGFRPDCLWLTGPSTTQAVFRIWHIWQVCDIWIAMHTHTHTYLVESTHNPHFFIYLVYSSLGSFALNHVNVILLCNDAWACEFVPLSRTLTCPTVNPLINITCSHQW